MALGYNADGLVNVAEDGIVTPGQRTSAVRAELVYVAVSTAGGCGWSTNRKTAVTPGDPRATQPPCRPRLVSCGLELPSNSELENSR